MLNKLTHSSPFIRLSLCLALSSGLHAGAAYLDWMSSPGSTSGGDTPVVVALLPTDHNVQNNPVEVEDAVKPDSVSKQVRVDKKVIKTPPVKPRVEPSEAVLQKDRQEEAASVNVKKPSKKSVATDLTCIHPLEETPDSPLDASGEELQVTFDQQNGMTDISLENTTTASASNDVNSQKVRHEELQMAVPKYRVNPKPEYPYVAVKKRWQGVVWLLVDVSSDGLVNNLQVEQSCGYRVLDKAARNSVKRWEFVPAMRAGLPVESQVRIPVRFRLEDS